MSSFFGLVYLCALGVHCGASELGDEFMDASNAGSFQHLVADVLSGKVYVGATNQLYQLSANLSLERAVETGPKEDNPNCPPPPSSECPCSGQNCKEFEKMPMDSVNKVLLIDYRGERLISCINLFQGHCEKHLLKNINLTDPPVWKMLVPNDEDSSVVMFVAPGAPNPASTEVLYVAATRSTKGMTAYKDIVPAICTRNLQDLDLVSDDILTPSRIDIEVQQRDQFRVDYVHGFGSLGFSYFLTVQKVAVITDSERYVTQVARICQNDKSLYSYTEVPLECHASGVHYNVLTAAYVVHPGADLAKSLGLPHVAPLTDMEHTLVAVFSNQTQSRAASASSAMCVYPLRDVRRKFTETIQRCFHGIGNTGPDHFVQPKACLSTVSNPSFRKIASAVERRFLIIYLSRDYRGAGGWTGGERTNRTCPTFQVSIDDLELLSLQFFLRQPCPPCMVGLHLYRGSTCKIKNSRSPDCSIKEESVILFMYCLSMLKLSAR